MVLLVVVVVLAIEHEQRWIDDVRRDRGSGDLRGSIGVLVKVQVIFFCGVVLV